MVIDIVMVINGDQEVLEKSDVEKSDGCQGIFTVLSMALISTTLTNGLKATAGIHGDFGYSKLEVQRRCL